MVYLFIFMLVSAPASGSGVTVVEFHSWEACEAAAEVVSRVDLPPLEKALNREEWDKANPDIVAVCANSGGANASKGRAKGWD